MNYFLSKASFTLHDFHEKTRQDLKNASGLGSSLSGRDKDKKSLEIQHKIMCAMYDQEKSFPEKMTQAERVEIA